MSLIDRTIGGSGTDPATAAGYDEHPARVGFFTDTSVCIGCKACEVACKEWNGVPDNDLRLTGMSYDNTVGLGADTWRHVAFIEQRKPLAQQEPGQRGDFRWLMASDVCKHCTHAACLDVCPTGSLFRTEFGTVVVQEDICNGCGYCISACPFGVIDQRQHDGRAWKCTLCYDRLTVGMEPACAQACPTDSIQFGVLDELRERAQQRVERLRDDGVTDARLYGHDPNDGVGGGGAFFLLLDEPEAYGLPPDPVVTTRDLPAMWRNVGLAMLTLAGSTLVAFRATAAMSDVTKAGLDGTRPGRDATVGVVAGRRGGGRRRAGEQPVVPDAEFDSYYGLPVLNAPVWHSREIAGYFFLGGLAGASSLLAAGAQVIGSRELATRAKVVATGAAALGGVALIKDLGRPTRFFNMLRVFKPTSPMSVGSWVLAGYEPMAAVAALTAVTGRWSRLGTAATAATVVLGPGVSTYTAALIADTAVPAWHDGYREMPFVFAGSSATAAGGIGLVLAPSNQAGPARRLAFIGAATETVAVTLMKRRIGMVAEPYHEGRSGQLMKMGQALTASGLALSVAGRRHRLASVGAGTLLAAASAVTRFGIFEAGKQSVADPRYVVDPQRVR